ncbi:unnamed protein product [Gadus morhua 'NCC']
MKTNSVGCLIGSQLAPMLSQRQMPPEQAEEVHNEMGMINGGAEPLAAAADDKSLQLPGLWERRPPREPWRRGAVPPLPVINHIPPFPLKAPGAV